MNFNELYPKKKEYYYLLMDIKTTAECNVSNCIIDKQKAKLLMRYINKKEKEIERLNNNWNKLKNELENILFFNNDTITYEDLMDIINRIEESDK